MNPHLDDRIAQAVKVRRARDILRQAPPGKSPSHMSGIDAYTVLMLHMDGADQSTTFTDSSYAGANSPHTVTANGDAQIDTAQSEFGGASGLFDGTGDYLSIPDSADWSFGTGDFTIDFWVNFSSTSGTQVFCGQYADTNNLWYLVKAVTTHRLGLQFKSGGTIYANYNMSGNWSPNTGTWYHIAFVRNGATGLIFIDGTSQALTETTAFGANDVGNVVASFLIAIHAVASGQFVVGSFDEFRVSKGVARWTSNFTPPTRAYSYLDKGFLGVEEANIGAISFGGTDISEANIRDIVYG